MNQSAETHLPFSFLHILKLGILQNWSKVVNFIASLCCCLWSICCLKKASYLIRKILVTDSCQNFDSGLLRFPWGRAVFDFRWNWFAAIWLLSSSSSFNGWTSHVSSQDISISSTYSSTRFLLVTNLPYGSFLHGLCVCMRLEADCFFLILYTGTCWWAVESIPVRKESNNQRVLR